MGDEKIDLFDKLPQGFREKFTQEILSRTTPADVARLSLVSKSFHSSANSDVVWDRFIPPDHRKLVLRGFRYCTFDSSKQTFMYICLLEHAEKYNDPLRLRLDQWTGKMCLVIKHQKHEITQLDTDYWKKTCMDIQSLVMYFGLKFRGKYQLQDCLQIQPTKFFLCLLSHITLIYYGIHIPREASVGIQGEESTKEIIYLDPRLAKSKSNHHYPTTKPTDVGLSIEVKLGEFFNKEGENRDVEITLKEVKSGRPKCGVQIDGMEMRPKHDTEFMTLSVSKCNFKPEKPLVMAEESYELLDFFRRLPEECIEEVVLRTSPMEACRLSLVSKRFLSAAKSNFVWEKFLPSDYQQLLDRADSKFPNKIKFSHKKDLFLFLIGNHVIMDGHTVCFWLNKRTGKKCFLISASITGHIEHGFSEHGWCRRAEKSRFQNRITLCSNVILFELHGKMNTSILSTYTTYTIYLVFHSSIYMDQKFDEPVEVSIATDGVESIKKVVYLNPHKMMSEGDSYLQYPQQRKDDRFEVELGEYFNRGGEGVNLEITMMEVKSGNPKNGPSIEGFEFRPKKPYNAVL